MTMRMPRPLVLFLLTAGVIVIGVCARIVIPVLRQHKAIQAVKRVDGHIVSENAPDWMWRWVRDERAEDLGRILLVDVSGTPFNDADAACLSCLESLEDLNLNAARIGDAATSHLRYLTKLHTLHVGSTAVSDAGLANLSGLRNLESLSLGFTKVTDEGLRISRSSRSSDTSI